LWVDGCGGFRLMQGTAWSVGGAGGWREADIAAIADWPRRAGEIRQEADDYFWVGPDGRRRLLAAGQPIPIPGSARLVMERPSALSLSARLSLAAPHRFAGHVDAVLLFRDTLLLGPGRGCHVRCPHAGDSLVLTRRQQTWLVKPTGSDEFRELVPGVRCTFEDLSMTLEAG
jgi:hypothetical protein